MLTAVIRLLVGLLTAVVIAFVAYVAGVRTKTPFVVNGVRKLSRATKRGPMTSAGRPAAYASVVRHVGRTTGKQYETPVRAVRTEGGFVIALPYGAGSDWVRNVLAHGSAAIVHAGTVYRVDSPEVLDLAGHESAFSPLDRWTHRLFDVRQCLRVRQVNTGVPAGKADASRRLSSD